MRATQLSRLTALTLTLAIAGCSQDSPPDKGVAAPSAENKVTVQPVTYPELVQEIGRHKGKVLVLDVWSTTWISCIKEFPHLVQMHRQRAADGLDVVSVSTDDPNEKGVMEKVRKFLEKENAAFPNLIFNEKEEVWMEKLGIGGPPAVFVFSRDGKVAKRYSEGEEYDVIEKFVVEELKKK